MRRVIKALVYDTEKAECVADWNNALGGSDFKHCNEGLYRTDRGRWFLHGVGGAMSPWSRPAGNMTSGGEGLRALTDDEAYEWLESHGATDAIEQHFSDKIEEA